MKHPAPGSPCTMTVWHHVGTKSHRILRESADSVSVSLFQLLRRQRVFIAGAKLIPAPQSRRLFHGPSGESFPRNITPPKPGLLRFAFFVQLRHQVLYVGSCVLFLNRSTATLGLFPEHSRVRSRLPLLLPTQRSESGDRLSDRPPLVFSHSEGGESEV